MTVRRRDACDTPASIRLRLSATALAASPTRDQTATPDARPSAARKENLNSPPSVEETFCQLRGTGSDENLCMSLTAGAGALAASLTSGAFGTRDSSDGNGAGANAGANCDDATLFRVFVVGVGGCCRACACCGDDADGETAADCGGGGAVAESCESGANFGTSRICGDAATWASIPAIEAKLEGEALEISAGLSASGSVMRVG